MREVGFEPTNYYMGIAMKEVRGKASEKIVN
jgi:hypothetical protein